MALEKFHHTLPDGYVLDLPNFEDIEIGAIRKIRKLGQIDQVLSLVEYYLDEEDLTHFDKMRRPDLEKFASAWRAGSAVEPGESSASSS